MTKTDQISKSNSHENDVSTLLFSSQQQIVEFIQDISNYRSQNSKESQIKAYLIFNPVLTQDQFKKLTKISCGTISETLKELTKKKEINVELNKSTKKYEYSLNSSYSKTSLAFAQGEDSLTKEIIFFQKKRNEILQKFEPSTSGCSFLIDRLDQLIHTYEFLLNFSAWTNECLKYSDKRFPPLITKEIILVQSKFDKQIDLDPSLLQVERNLINHLTNHQILRHHSEITAEILAYFYLRGKITQQKIKELTSFSNGRISQTFKELENFHYIRKIVPRKRPYHYVMPSILEANIHLLCESTEKLLSWQERLAEIQRNLENRAEIFLNNPTFNKMSHFLNGIFQFIPIYKKAHKELSEKINTLHEKKGLLM
ncbi:hypothetical protein [Candidatus Lokiarchaeum ossiferum]|uniref:hypothetical protein n=1 Tax=Candidatus Lokiarchaeum ossiferum TaxID=2951803 RepID=UPI00352FE204